MYIDFCLGGYINNVIGDEDRPDPFVCLFCVYNPFGSEILASFIYFSYHAHFVACKCYMFHFVVHTSAQSNKFSIL